MSPLPSNECASYGGIRSNQLTAFGAALHRNAFFTLWALAASPFFQSPPVLPFHPPRIASCPHIRVSRIFTLRQRIAFASQVRVDSPIGTRGGGGGGDRSRLMRGSRRLVAASGNSDAIQPKRKLKLQSNPVPCGAVSTRAAAGDVWTNAVPGRLSGACALLPHHPVLFPSPLRQGFGQPYGWRQRCLQDRPSRLIAPWTLQRRVAYSPRLAGMFQYISHPRIYSLIL